MGLEEGVAGGVGVGGIKCDHGLVPFCDLVRPGSRQSCKAREKAARGGAISVARGAPPRLARSQYLGSIAWNSQRQVVVIASPG